MNEVLVTIKEVQEGGKHLANHYLQHGYILLEVQQGARAQKMPEGGVNGRQYFVRRNPVYVLGRPDGVEPADPPPRRTSPEADKGEEHGSEQEKD